MPQAATAVTLTISCTGVGEEAGFCKTAALQWAGETGNRVRVVTPPGDASERLALYQQLLAAGTDRIDVLQIDVVWPGLLAVKLLDLRPYTGGAEQAHFERFVANNTIEGRLVAMPWFANAGLLYYRRDLLQKYGLPVPATWEALTQSAALIQAAERREGHDRIWGFVWQGRAYEGLTCNALEWIASHGGGRVVDANGQVTVDNPGAVGAVQLAASWVGSISPTAVLNYAEEGIASGVPVRQRGLHAQLALCVGAGTGRGQRGARPRRRQCAAGGAAGAANRPATLGGESLAVPLATRHPAEAVALVLYLTGAAVQKERALRGSFNPTLRAL